MLSVANSCHYNKNLKYGKHRLKTTARPAGAAPANPHPRPKAWMQKTQGGGKFFVQIPAGARGVVMDEIDTCISISQASEELSLPMTVCSDCPNPSWKACSDCPNPSWKASTEESMW